MIRPSVLAFAILAISHLHAQVFTQGSLKYAVNGEGCVAIIGCTSSQSGFLRVPNQIVYQGSSYRVNAIRARAFAGQSKVLNLILPEQLDTIGFDAFYGCHNLRNITGLKRLDVCEPYAFSKTALTSLDWSQDTVGTLCDGVFAQCTKLAQVSLPAELTSLPEAIFQGCTSLTSVNLSSLPLTQIGPRAFAHCTAFQALELPSTLLGIGDEAFAGMTALISIELPAGITSIGVQAFADCSMLQTVELPDGLVTLGYSPFARSGALREVVLPAKITDIDDKFVFADCPALETISIAASAPYYSSTDGVLRNRLGNKIIAYPPTLSRQVHPTLRTTSQPLAPGALMGCELDEVLLLPAPVNTIPREAFAGTSGLKSLEMATRSNLTTIEIRAFEKSRDLTYVDIPSKTKTIGNAAFRGDESIQEIFVWATSAPALPDSAFSQTVYENAVLYTPTGKTELYTSAPGWSLFNHISDDSATGIERNEELRIKNEELNDEAVYDLAGRKVFNGKLRQGIYIVNAKKRVIK